MLAWGPFSLHGLAKCKQLGLQKQPPRQYLGIFTLQNVSLLHSPKMIHNPKATHFLAFTYLLFSLIPLTLVLLRPARFYKREPSYPTVNTGITIDFHAKRSVHVEEMATLEGSLYGIVPHWSLSPAQILPSTGSTPPNIQIFPILDLASLCVTLLRECLKWALRILTGNP